MSAFHMAEKKIDNDQPHPDAAQEQEAKSSVPAYRDPLQSYLMEVRKIQLLVPQEEKALAVRYRETGDAQAAYKLVTANLRLVVKIALEHQRQWMMSLQDLIQEGNLGLMQAVKNFDPYRGVKLSYYASYWIKAYILKYIMDNWKLVKIGTTQVQRKLFFNLQKEKNRLEKMGFYPGPARLAEALGTDEDKVVEMEQRLGDWEPSLDQPVGDDWKETRGDMLSADDELFDEGLADNELQQIFNLKLEGFRQLADEKEQDILEKRLLASRPETLQAIGDIYGITKERVRQIENRLKQKIRQYMEEELPDFKALKLPSQKKQ
ncbi:MAG: sigma-70 family RNA polymerase sigma factor [Deltaproteobacteria bacterium]|nr:sigma-70 family RNA polymerase sigma factor [Deltaproteobacteria bacterium]